MAAESGGELLKVLGEYGVFLVEMGSLRDIYGGTKVSSRIKYTCISVGKKFIAIGASSGGIYLYNKKTLEYFRLLSTKDGGITQVCFAVETNYLGLATSNGIVVVVDVGSRTRDKPKYLRRSEEHKNATVTCLCWDDSDNRLFASDDRGFVSACYMPTKFGSNASRGKRGLISQGSVIVGKSETAINQIDYAAEKLLISTMTKTAVLDLATLQCWLVGSKPREGKFGACFLKQFNQESATIYTSRPGSRLWEAGMDGQVISTQQYKQLFAVPASPVLGYSHTANAPPQSATECQPRSFNFSKLLLIRERFLLTWLGNNIFLLDPVLGQLAGWYELTKEISDICCHGNQFYVYHEDGHMSWFGVLTVKETVARLFELKDFNQCTKVALECKAYLVSSTARDWVPVSMVTSLVRCLQEQPGNEELVLALQDLEQSLQEDANLPFDRLSSFHGDSSTIDSPETMSVNSDLYSYHMDSGLEDDDNLSVNQNDTSGKTKKEDSEFSLENALFSVAVKAKRFAEERRSKRKFNLPNFINPSTNDEMTHKTTDQNEGLSPSQLETNVPDQDEMYQDVPSNSHTKRIVAKDSSMSTSLVVDSDDNDSRCDDEIQDIKKAKEKTKKKKKKKVVTVDINTPSTKITSKGEKHQIYERKETLTSQHNHQPTRLKRSKSERDTPLSPVISPYFVAVPSELPPAIPAMLSKAKGMIKKKLKETAADNQHLKRSQSLPIESRGEASESEEEEDEVDVSCPLEVKELEKATCTAREQIQSPKVLYSRPALQEALQEWLHVLLKALHSYKDVSRSESDSNRTIPELSLNSSTTMVPPTAQNPTTLLNKDLGEEVYKNVCLLTKMCLEVGVFFAGKITCSKSCEHHPHASNCNCSCGKVGIKMKCEKVKNGCEMFPCNFNGKSNLLTETCTDGSNQCEEAEKQDKICNDNENHELESRQFVNIPSSKDTHCKASDDGVTVFKNSSPDQPSSTADHLCTTKISMDNYSQEDRLTWSCTSCSKHFNSKFLAPQSSSSQASVITEVKRDEDRALFLTTCFSFLNVRDIRRSLSLTPGVKCRTWKALLDCIGEFSKADEITNHIKNGHVTRALHMLHDGIVDYQDKLLLHLKNLFEQNGRETLTTCARMFPDLYPWEVMEMCRHSVSHDPKASAQYFVYYLEQLTRWRASMREKRPQIIKSLSKDRVLMNAWLHCALIASNPNSQQHCECGLPRPGSHKLPWKHEEHLHTILETVCEQPTCNEMDVLLNMFWKHGYWPGFLQLCSAKGYRHIVLESIVCLGDLSLLEEDLPWGPTPRSMDEWRLLLELVASKSTEHSIIRENSNWIPNMTWESVLHLALKRLGPSRLLSLMQDVPYQGMPLPNDFYYKCVMGVVIEKEQSNLVHQMLTKVDTYLWSKRAGVLSPQVNCSRIQEQKSAPKTENSKIEITSTSHLKTLEDSATNWGVNVHLSEAACPVCTLHLSEQVSSRNQGLLVFECGHVYHKFCVPEQACVVCFHKNLKTLRINTDSSMKIE